MYLLKKLSWNVRLYAVLCGCLVAPLILSAASTARAQYRKHSEFQAVDNDGLSTYTFVSPQTLKGVVLNNPEDMLNGAPNFIPWLEDESNAWKLGGTWQVYIQAVEPGDWGGTALWMGQNYGNLPWRRGSEFSYSNTDWENELERLNDPEDNDNPFRAGDLIEVFARGSLWHAGKQNVNEEHWKTSNYDFDISILERGIGLPVPEVINISDVKYPSDEWIFDATDPDEDGIPKAWDDVLGGEKYQAQFVTVQNVELVDGEAAKWQPDATLMVTDPTGRTFPMHLGLNADLAALTPPTGAFNATGIFDQEAETAGMGIDGYRLWVMGPADVVELIPGDLDADGFVGGNDLDIVRSFWGQNVTNGDLLCGDPSWDGFVGGNDLDLVRAHWGEGTPPDGGPAPVPEPATLAGILTGSLLLGGFVILRRRRILRAKAPQTGMLAALLVVLAAGSASAELSMRLTPVDNSGTLTGYVTQDVGLSTDSDWLSAQLLITLTEGEIFQQPVAQGGGNFPPNPAFFAVYPELEFDSFITGGQNDPVSSPGIDGGAVDLGGDAVYQLDEDPLHCNVAWSTPATDDIGDLTLARITLSDDAEGTWQARFSNKGEGARFFGGPVGGGAMVPEPGTLVMLTLGVLCLIGYQWRRRNAE